MAHMGPAIISLANGANGLNVSFESNFLNQWNQNPTTLLNCNGQAGLNVFFNSEASVVAAAGQGEMKTNGQNGLVCYTSSVQIDKFSITGNANTALFASNRAIVNINTSTYTGSVSPAFNTVGNGNALITT
jgi:hypothetical protein